MTQVTRVNDELGFVRQCVDFIDGCFQRSADIGVRRFVEAHMAVADLYEIKLAKLAFCAGRLLAERPRAQYAVTDGPDDSRSGPGHAFEKAAPVDAIVVVIMNDSFGHFRPLHSYRLKCQVI